MSWPVHSTGPVLPIAIREQYTLIEVAGKLTSHTRDDADRDVESINSARVEVVGVAPISTVSMIESSQHTEQCARVDVELSKGWPGRGGPYAVDTARALARLTVALIIAPGASPDTAFPAGRELHGVALAVLHNEPARLGTVVDDLWVETWVNLLVAVVDELHAGAAVMMSIIPESVPGMVTHAEQRAVKTPRTTATREIMAMLVNRGCFRYGKAGRSLG